MNIKIYNQNVWAYPNIGNRTKLISELVYEYDADICAFQECEPVSIRAKDYDIAEFLKDTYNEVPTSAGNINCTPIFYKATKFRVVDSGWKLLDGLNNANTKSYTWCVFEDIETLTRFACISTHFWWKFDSPEDFLQRLKNAEEIYQTATKIQTEYDVPVIFSGDLNSGENALQGSDPIDKIKDLGFVDARDISDNFVGHFTLHKEPVADSNNNFYCTDIPTSTLDHVFILPDNRVKIKNYVIDLSEKALSSSDHCPLLIDAEILQ